MVYEPKCINMYKYGMRNASAHAGRHPIAPFPLADWGSVRKRGDGMPGYCWDLCLHWTVLYILAWDDL